MFDVADGEEDEENRVSEEMEETRLTIHFRGKGEVPALILGRRHRQRRPAQKGDERRLVELAANSPL